MAENAELINIALSELLNITWSFDDRFGSRVFLLPAESEKQRLNLSFLRRHKAITVDERIGISAVIKLGETRYREFIEKITNQPRVDAQKFIGKKNVRLFIFNRDNNECLRCLSRISLSLDHIVPVNRNGQNKIMNLQTLCSSCNSWKSDRIIDFRPGARVLNKYLKTISIWISPVTA